MPRVPYGLEGFAARNYGGNPSGGSGLGSYTREQFNQDYYGAAPRQAAISEMFSRRRSQDAMAEMAAQRMEALGGQGSYWAEQIRKDPRAAIALADQYGGFETIEQGIVGARQAGEMQKAMGKAATPEDVGNLILRTQGPDAYKAWAEGRKAMGESMNPAGSFDLSMAMQIRGDYTKRMGDFSTIRHYYDVAASNLAEAAKNTKAPGAVDFALIQAYAKMLDPNSVVRESEAGFVVESGSSQVEDFINRVNKVWSSAGVLNPTARYNIVRQIEATYRGAEAKQRELLEEMGGELDRLGATGNVREVATPIGIEPSTSKIDLAPWREAAMSPMPMPEDKGKLEDGAVYQTPRGMARWDADAGEFEAVE